MPDNKRFPFEKAERLDSPERRQRQPPEPLVRIVVETKACRVLDIGVGTGYFALELARQMPQATIIGLDIEPRMLDIFRDRAVADGFGDRVEVHLVPPNAPETIPLGDASVGVALMANLYHEIENRVRYLREVRRVLEPGGLLLLCDWDPEGTQEAGPPKDHRIPRHDAVAELGNAGFSAVRPHAVYPDLYVFAAR